MSLHDQLIDISERLRDLQAQLEAFPVIMSYEGNPNGLLEAMESTMCWDTQNQALYLNVSIGRGTDWELAGTGDPGDHDPVTLTAILNANLLSLTGQELDLDTQGANLVFAGPTTGADAPPSFRALTSDDTPTMVLPGPGIDVVSGDTVGLGFDLPLLSRGDGTPLEEYSTLALALAAANSGNTIWLPPGLYTGDHTVPAGVALRGFGRYVTYLTGQITLGGSDTVLHNISIPRTVDTTDTAVGLVGPATGTARVFNCGVNITQIGTGDAYAISHTGSGNLWLTSCYLYATGGDGDPRAVFRSGSGNVYVINCVCPMSAPMSE